MAKLEKKQPFSPAALLCKDFTSHAASLLAQMRKLLKTPGDTKIIHKASNYGCRLEDIGVLTRIFYKENPVEPFLNQLQPCCNATDKIVKLRKWQELTASLKDNSAYSALFINQLKVREKDWRAEISLSINYLNFKAADNLMKTVKKGFKHNEPACITPKKWCGQQLLSLRKPHKVAFKERGQNALSQLASRLRNCILAAELCRPEFSPLLPPAKSVAKLHAAIESANLWSGLEDTIISFAGHTPLRGRAKLENSITKATRAACREAAELRDSLLAK